MGNLTIQDLPPLPHYTLTPLASLVSPIPDKLLTLLLPIAAYWGLSMFFHWIDSKDYFPQYRLHTPAEVLKRNHVSRWEVFRDVMTQQVVQTAVGWVLGLTEPEDVVGKDSFNVAVWARRVRIAQKALPGLLSLFGVNAMALANNIAIKHPEVAGAISGGRYTSLMVVTLMADGKPLPRQGFANWEMLMAKAIYWALIPALQFGLAILIVDTWQYFLHRAMHMNKWLYSMYFSNIQELCLTFFLATFHSRHHRLYVPYAYGALYNHPFEGFLLDTLGTAIAFKVARLSTRQGMWFFTGSTIKTVDDHCGYALPWDPLQHLTSNNAGYHDIHHQSWGIKTNFSQPFFTFWDRLLGTVWTGGDVSARYERARVLAQRKIHQESITHSNFPESATQSIDPYGNAINEDTEMVKSPGSQSSASPAGKAAFQAASSRQQVLDDPKDGGVNILAEEAREEKEVRNTIRRSARRKTTSSLSPNDSFKGLRDRVTGSMHGRTGGIIGVDSNR